MFAGFLNVLAGGGSLLTLPLLIFMGLPPGVANASNRLGIILQNIFAVQGFKSKGVSVFPFAYWVALSACLGALLGSQIAVEIPDGLFNKILAIIMLLVMGVTVFKPGLSTNNIVEDFSKKRVWLSVVLFFFVGVYGGFIQAGVGFIMIAALSLVHSLPMARLNSIKVFVALCYTCVAVVVFIVNDMIRWDYGLTLAFGTAIGGWLTSRWSVTVPDKYVRGFLLVTVTALSIKLWFF
ncbi:MAG: sulfite exporter TauE/SafE family protein [Cytophagales bacterium]|nr:sulfite exporter TauE/SafE family protein [Cytophagales bacterium]